MHSTLNRTCPHSTSLSAKRTTVKAEVLIGRQSLVSLGFFTKTNYTFIQFTAGLDALEPDSTKQFVSIALIVSLALPGIVAVVALIFILKRRLSPSHSSSYDVIED